MLEVERFNTGLEQANLILHSNVLPPLWDQVNREIDTSASSSSSSRLRHAISKEGNQTVVIFATSRDFAAEKLRQQGISDLVSSIDAKESFEFFKFLREKTDFSVNRAIIALFHEHRDEFPLIKKQITENESPEKPLIIAGNSLGGSIAVLFTLWLLDSVDFSGKKRPICVTFGSPLIGDERLQRALYKHSPWSSSFLHVAANGDPVPRMFSSVHKYFPFGTFLLCSPESGSSCFDEPETVLRLLAKTGSENRGTSGEIVDYGKVLEDLKQKALFKKKKKVETEWATNLYQLGTITQLSAIGLVPNSLSQQKKSEIEHLADEIAKWEMKYQIGKRKVRPDKKLNDSKINMAILEWYKKFAKDDKIGYYDSYKNRRFMKDVGIQECVKRLMIYWTDLVEEADMKPQSEFETLRTRWLYGGLNYMRLVEPLYIAEFYSHEGLSGYEDNARPGHFKRLEDLVSKAKIERPVPVVYKKMNIDTILTTDSCFWAKVEEALIWCELMKRKESSEGEKRECESKLKEFEGRVVNLIRNYDVSSEIFLEQSTFMLWWKSYMEAIEITGVNYKPALSNFMVNREYKKYSNNGESIRL